MNTIILPGFSIKNKDWAEEVKRKLRGIVPTKVICWEHWKNEKAKPGWIENEAEKIIESIGNNRVNLLAKSISTAVAMVVLKSKKEQVNKTVLCGIPVNDFLEGDENYYSALKTISSEVVLCIQNKGDDHGSFSDVEKFVRSINPDIKVREKPRLDHEYLYFSDFGNFFQE